ncbi:MAG: TM2 domain-containing protein [Eubacterium sp.]|nr:TM2 domain-containing protein [Eubacterium sp.]
MNFCPECGRELAEGEVCTCTQNTVPVAETPVQEETAVITPEAAPETQEMPPFIPPEMADKAAPTNPEAYAYIPPQQFQQNAGTYFVPPVVPGTQQQAYNNGIKTDGPANTDYPEGYHIKRKYAAVILAATLGVFGIHNFYLGDSNKAIIHILVATLGSLFFGLGFVASYIWSIVETVQLLGDYIDRDVNGYKLQTFEEALVKTRMEAEKKQSEE